MLLLVTMQTSDCSCAFPLTLFTSLPVASSVWILLQEQILIFFLILRQIYDETKLVYLSLTCQNNHLSVPFLWLLLSSICIQNRKGWSSLVLVLRQTGVWTGLGLGQLSGGLYKITVNRTVKYCGLKAVIWAMEACLKYVCISEYSQGKFGSIHWVIAKWEFEIQVFL